jgi:hypothetical protein
MMRAVLPKESRLYICAMARQDVSHELIVKISKRNDGSAVLSCTRRNGSTTWQKQSGRTAMFFPFHDLTHYAVETTLRFRQGFFGLIAEGWDIDETGGKSARGSLPPEAGLVEHIVGLLDRERVGGAPPLTATEFNAQLAEYAATGRTMAARSFSDSELDAVRHTVDSLHNAWAAIEPGGALQLGFDRAS